MIWIMINERRFNNFFFISLVIILIAELILNFFSANITGLFKFIFYFYIYISFLLLAEFLSILAYNGSLFENTLGFEGINSL